MSSATFKGTTNTNTKTKTETEIPTPTPTLSQPQISPVALDTATKTTSICPKQNNEPQNTQNSKFIERVLSAMRSSKPQAYTTPAPKPLTSTSTPSTAKLRSGMGHPCQESNSSSPSGVPLCKDTSNSSLSSVNTNVSSVMSPPPPSPSPRPPKPPQDSSRLRKQMRLVPKQRERSPALKLTNGSSSRYSNYDSDDGLKMPEVCNGYVPRSRTAVEGEMSTEAGEVPMEVKLKLPLPKLDAKSTQSHLTNGAYNLRNSLERSRLLTRSPSPAFSVRSTSSRASSICSSVAPSSRSSFSRLQTPPRRVFPQTYVPGESVDAYEMRKMEQSPVVFDGNLSFVLDCKKQPVHQSLRPTPSYEDPRTSSAYLSEKIQNFLKRTDHVQEEWTALGRRSRARSTATSVTNSGRTTPTNSVYDDTYDTINLIERQRERNSMERCPSVGRTKSSQNILTKAFQMAKTMPRISTSRSNSLARDINGMDDDDRTINEEDDRDMDEVRNQTIR